MALFGLDLLNCPERFYIYLPHQLTRLWYLDVCSFFTSYNRQMEAKSRLSKGNVHDSTNMKQLGPNPTHDHDDTFTSAIIPHFCIFLLNSLLCCIGLLHLVTMGGFRESDKVGNIFLLLAATVSSTNNISIFSQKSGRSFLYWLL